MRFVSASGTEDRALLRVTDPRSVGFREQCQAAPAKAAATRKHRFAAGDGDRSVPLTTSYLDTSLNSPLFPLEAL